MEENSTEEEGTEGLAEGPLKTSTSDDSFKEVVRPVDKSILMAETQNVVHEPFTANDELKVNWILK